MLAALLLASLLSAAPTSVARPDPHVRVSLIAATTSVAPGSTFTLGVRFEIDDQWHIYWNGVNDSGQPPKITLALPPGWTASEFRWPAPVRHASDIVLDHIYEGDVTLLTTVSVPADAAHATLKADVSWMVCKDVCLIERGSAALDLPCSTTPTDRTPHAAVLEAAEKRVPKAISSLPPDQVPARTVSEPASTAGSAARRGFEVEGATRLEFYPQEDCPALSDLLNEGSVRNNRILLTLADGEADRPLKGVLAVWSGNLPHPAYYQFD